MYVIRQNTSRNKLLENQYCNC